MHGDHWRRPGTHHPVDQHLQRRGQCLGEPSLKPSAPPRSDPHETAERVGVVNTLVPHLQQALRTHEQLTDTNRDPVDISSVASDVIGHAVIVVASGGVVVQINSAARQVTLAADGLKLQGETIQASSASTNTELRDCVSKALVRQSGKASVGSYLICGRPSGKRPYAIRVVPLDAGDDPCLALAAIIVIDPEREIKPPKELLQKLFNLTDAESEVALRMLNGDGLKTIANSSPVSITTVKTHLQRIFRKTGTHRQAELVRLLIAIA
jgi:DNA-binding CsgD family transcriptional regulator